MEFRSHVSVVLRVNGRPHEVVVDARTILLDLLREQLDLTGAKRAETLVSVAPAPCIWMEGA